MKLSNYMIGLLTLCWCASCDTDSSSLAEQTDTKKEIEVKLNSHIGQYADSPALLLPQGTVVGIYAAPYSQTPLASEPECSNVRCISDDAGNLNSAGRLKLHQGEDYSFYAYAPHKADAINHPDAIPFAHGEDVLLCTEKPSLRNVTPDNCNVSVDFVHLTSQIRFIVQVNENAEVGKLQATSVFHASGFLPEAHLNLATGELIAEGEVTEQTDVKVAATPDEQGGYSLATGAVCFFTTPDEPQTIHLRVTHENITYTGDITAVFVPGESAVYTVWIDSKSHLRVTVSATDWINRYESIDIN